MTGSINSDGPVCRRVAVGAVLLGGVVAGPLMAQDADPVPESGEDPERSAMAIEEIVVTAQFRQQSLQETPIAITAMSGDMLEARSQNNVVEVASFAPNVNLTTSNSTWGNSVQAYIRGVGQQDSNPALEPGVGIYIDDVYYGATFGAVFDLSDLDRVEVLRGPQGTLAGKNSVGGAIKLFSRKPDGSGDGYLDFTYGSFSRVDLRAGADFTITDEVFMRVSAVSKRRDGYMTLLDYGCANPGNGIEPQPRTSANCEIGTEGGQDLDAMRVALRYVSDGSPLEFNLIADLAEDQSEAAPNKLIYADNPFVRSYVADDPAAGVPLDSRFLTGAESYTSYANYRNGGNYTAFNDRSDPPLHYHQVEPGSFVSEPVAGVTAWGVSGTIDYDFGNGLSLKSITAYREAAGISGTDIDASPLDVELIHQRLSHEQITQELRLNGSVGDWVDYTVGAFYYDADDQVDAHVEIPANLLNFLSNSPANTTSQSVFAHAEFHLSDRLNLITGLRYTDDEKSYAYGRSNTDGTQPSGVFLTENFSIAGLDGQSATFAGDQVDYRLGVNYRFTDEVMGYAQVSTGFKGGGVNPRPFFVNQVQTFGPEELTTYELGWKSDLFDSRLRMNGAVFFNKYADKQVNLLACPDTPCALPANAGDADIQGVELELIANPIDSLRIDLNVGYLDFEYTRVNPATGLDLSFESPFVNEWQASGGIEYLRNAFGGTMTTRIDGSYQSSFYYNANNSPGSKVDGRSIYNARMTYETFSGEWSLSLAVTNLLDEFYYQTKFDNSSQFLVITGMPGRPREWSMTVKRRF